MIIFNFPLSVINKVSFFFFFTYNFMATCSKMIPHIIFIKDTDSDTYYLFCTDMLCRDIYSDKSCSCTDNMLVQTLRNKVQGIIIF